MNVVEAVHAYVTRMVEATAGMKIMLLDADTTSFVTMVYSQTQILQKEVYLVERLDMENREAMAHLKAIVFVRPTDDNIQRIVAELRNPLYGEYHLYFSSVIRKSHLEELAEGDEHQLVQSVREYYADFSAVNPDLFSLNIGSVVRAEAALMNRVADGVCAALLALRKKPHIRWQKNSEACRKLANDITLRMDRESNLFDFRRGDQPPLLLLLDRRNDPVTPLLTQWTFQAMTHELMGITNQRVSLESVPGIRKDMKEVVLNQDQDPFFKQNMFQNFGDLGVNLKELVDEFQSKTKTTKDLNSIAEMKKFVEEFPEFRKMSGNVSKHVTLISEMSRLIDQRLLFEVSELEQELACHEDHQAGYKATIELLHNPKLNNYDRLRLTMLYALRYETTNDNYTHDLLDICRSKGASHKEVELVHKLLTWAGASQRSDDLFGKNLFAQVKKSIQKGVKGIENVYTQHQPLLAEQLDLLFKGKLREALYPFQRGGASKERPTEVIVFIVGGATFEEARVVGLLNQSHSGVHVVLGGTTILNSRMFLDEVDQVPAGKRKGRR